MRRHSKLSWVVLVAAACGCLGAGLARAEGSRGPSVVVLPFQSAQSELSALVSQRVTDLLLEELRQGNQVTALDQGAVGKAARPVPAPVVPPGLKTAERLYADGREKVRSQEFEDAVQILARAVQQLEESLVGLSDYGLVADAHLWHAIALYRAGQEEEGKKSLQRALVVRPDLQLSPQRYPPLFIRIVEQVRAGVQKGPRGRLRVATAPAGCEVLVNGLLRGRTPLDLRDLPVGRHSVRVSCAGYEPQAAVREATPAGTEASFQLVPARGGVGTGDPLPILLGRLRQGLVDADTVARTQDVAVRSLADYALIGFFARGSGDHRLRAYLLRAQDSRLAELPASRFDLELLNAAEQAKLLARAVEKAVLAFPVAGDVAVAPAGEGAGPRREIRSSGDLARAESMLHREELERLAREERERRFGPLAGDFDPTGTGKTRVETPFYKKWWFWSIVGGVLAAGAAGAAIGASGGTASGNVGLRWTPP